jgi:nitrate/nitrite-specific signal transduction histidine kinase
MRERADLVNGLLDLENVSSGGARVRLTVPAGAQETHD